MGKTIRSDNPFSKKYEKRPRRHKNEHNEDEFGHRKHEKGHFPQRAWPTGSESHKGQKI